MSNEVGEYAAIPMCVGDQNAGQEVRNPVGAAPNLCWQWFFTDDWLLVTGP